jgi:hypothetical protein
MASEYQLVTNFDGVKHTEDEAFIPNDGGNRDWNVYTEWLAEGNEPDPAPAPPDPAPPEPLELPAEPTEDMHAATKGYVDTEVAAMGARLDALERWAAPYQQQQQPRPS